MKSFSVSKMLTFMQCPRAFHFIYNLGLVSRRNVNLFYGSAIHSAIASYYRGGDPVATIKNKLMDDSPTKPDDFDLKKYLNEGVKLMETFVNDAPYFKPVLVEEFKSTNIYHPITKEPLQLPLRFIIDLIGDVNGKRYIVDHKTTSSASPQIDELNRIQAIAYTMAYKSLYGKHPDSFVFNYLVKRVRKPKVVPIFFECGIDDEVWFFNLAKEIIGMILNGDCLTAVPMTKTYYPCPAKIFCTLHG